MSEPICLHSMQDWYIREGKGGCYECDELEAKTRVKDALRNGADEFLWRPGEHWSVAAARAISDLAELRAVAQQSALALHENANFYRDGGDCWCLETRDYRLEGHAEYCQQATAAVDALRALLPGEGK